LPLVRSRRLRIRKALVVLGAAAAANEKQPGGDRGGDDDQDDVEHAESFRLKDRLSC
jgi:hypothetical protein